MAQQAASSVRTIPALLPANETCPRARFGARREPIYSSASRPQARDADKAIDQTLGNGWGSDSIDSGGSHITPEIVVQLPTSITVTQFAIDPANTCGDDATASTKDYRVETSADGSTWTVAKEGTFGNADRGRLNLVDPTAGATNVRYIRFTMLSQQLAASCGTSPNQSGCLFADMSELEVYGRPS